MLCLSACGNLGYIQRRNTYSTIESIDILLKKFIDTLHNSPMLSSSSHGTDRCGAAIDSTAMSRTPYAKLCTERFYRLIRLNRLTINKLYFGDNLETLHKADDERVHLICTGTTWSGVYLTAETDISSRRLG